MAQPETAIPPLVPGERLRRAEFLRRWDAMPQVRRAELIDGVVYMPSPVTLQHGASSSLMDMWLGVYRSHTPGCQVMDSATWLMLEDAPQPDVAMRILPEHGGQSSTEGQYCSGAPELVVEVSLSSASCDVGPKLRLYQRAGVEECLTVLLHERKIVWRVLEEGRYRSLEPGTDDILRSRIFPGLWLDVEAALAGDGRRLLESLGQGLASPEHAAFVERLRAAGQASPAV